MKKLLDQESTDFVTRNLLMNYCLYDDNALLIESFLHNNHLKLNFDINRYWLILSGTDKKYNVINDSSVFHEDVHAANTFYDAVKRYMNLHDIQGNIFLVKADNTKIPALFFSIGQSADVTVDQVAAYMHKERKSYHEISSAGKDVSAYATTAFGGPYSGYEGMHQAYAEVSHLNRLHYFTGADQIITPAFLSAAVDPGMAAVYNACHQLRIDLCQAKKEAVEKDLDFLLYEIVCPSLKMEYLNIAHISMVETFGLFNSVYDLDIDTGFQPDDFFSIHEYRAKLGQLVKELYDVNGRAFYSPFILMVAAYLKVNYTQPATLKTISSYLGINSSWLSTQFNNEMGMSLPEYINRLRVREAQRLLRETNLSIEEIQMKTGFGSLRYFNDIFHRITSMTPLQYRKSQSLELSDSDL